MTARTRRVLTPEEYKQFQRDKAARAEQKRQAEIDKETAWWQERYQAKQAAKQAAAERAERRHRQREADERERKRQEPSTPPPGSSRFTPKAERASNGSSQNSSSNRSDYNYERTQSNSSIPPRTKPVPPLTGWDLLNLHLNTERLPLAEFKTPAVCRKCYRKWILVNHPDVLARQGLNIEKPEDKVIIQQRETLVQNINGEIERLRKLDEITW